ncbi:MAG TPA: ACP S-malonyltransferase [Mariprofundaceae bacterium]|nr:ACP S-malonyltransferase [Mariprofundaceae bacterium]
MLNTELAFLFPGQGSQSVGMLSSHLEQESVVADTFSEASDAVGYDVRALVMDNPDGRLDQTEYTQPALLTASTALLRLWRARGGVEAGQLAGHSLGEYSALVAAGSLAFDDAVRLVSFRGRAMSEAVPQGMGRMAAILGLDDDQLTALCEQASDTEEKVWAANFNCPGQLVVAGHADAVDRLIDLAKGSGAKRALPLAVSAPSHTPLMQPAADAMAERLSEVNVSDPDRPVWSNAWARPVSRADEVRQALVEQLVSPVCWTDTIRHMRKADVSRAVEMGPGKVLAGLVKRIDRNINVFPTDEPARMIESLESVAGSGD